MLRSRTLRAALAACALSLVSACAQGATARGMTIVPTDIRSPLNANLARSVAVAEVGGGEKTNPLWAPKIDDDSFRTALVESLRAVGFLADSGALLALQARLVTLDQPSFGLDMTVTSVVRYTLKDVRSGVVIMDEDLKAAHTATIGDAFVGTTRLQLANEGSARKNIAALIERMNQIRVRNAAAPAM